MSTIPTGESLQIGDGYGDWNPFIGRTPDFPTASIPATYKTVSSTETVWVPPTQGVAGTPSVPATPTQVIYNKNKGWNTWARSVEQLDQGKFYIFTCDRSNEGLCLGLGPATHLGRSISSFTHAIVLDVGAIKVYENGVVTAILATDYSILSGIKLFYQADGSIVYVVTTGTETIVHTSSTPYIGIDAYMYAYIYSSDDVLKSSEYISGTVQYGSA